MLVRQIPWLVGRTNVRRAIVVAHYDDEIFLAAVLVRDPFTLVIHVTDSVPDDASEWKGFPTRDDYAAARAIESNDALDRAGHRGKRVSLGIRDTCAMRDVYIIAARLREIFVEHHIDQVFTHAYEGGHPDHDAVAMAVHWARKGRILVESPYYRKDGSASLWQKFISIPDVREFELVLNEFERQRKADMIAAYVSQRAAVDKICRQKELYRHAPIYDFRLPPNDGNLARNYERAGISAASWDR